MEFKKGDVVVMSVHRETDGYEPGRYLLDIKAGSDTVQHLLDDGSISLQEATSEQKKLWHDSYYLYGKKVTLKL